MKLGYMRTLFLYLAGFSILILLNACGTTTSDTVSQSEVSKTQSQPLSQIDYVPERYIQYEGFDDCRETATSQCSIEDDTCIAEGLDQCMIEAAAFTGDSSAVSCDEFLSKTNQDNCRFSEVFSEAIQARDVSVCSSLTGESLERCTTEITSVLVNISGDVNLCESLTGERYISCRNNYFMNRAIEEINPDLCSEIEMYFDSMDIEEEFAIMSDDMNFERQMCIEQVEMIQELLEDE